MTQAERVLDYLWSIAPNGATNGELARSLGIRSHQTVYMLTQQLLHRGRIRGGLSGTTWVFQATEEPVTTLGAGSAWTKDPTPAARFEALARRAVSEHYRVDLTSGSVQGVAKMFDFVSTDGNIVGDAMYFSRVGGVGLPAAKFSIIAEHVWLLEKASAPTAFLVFGNDGEIPLRWLARYGKLASSVAFLFLADDSKLERLAGPER